MSFAKIIKELREQKGYSQEELAKLLDTKRSNIANWETRGEPDYATLIKLASFFNVTVDYLLGMTYGTQEHTKMEATLKDGTSVKDFMKLMALLNKEDQQLMIKYVIGKVAETELEESIKNKNE